MSTDRGDNDREGGQKHGEMLEEGRESVGEERRERVHSDGGSPIPRNQDVQNSGNSAENTSKVSGPPDREKKEKHREGSEGDRQNSGYSSKESLLSGKRSHSETSPQHLPEKKRKMSESTDEREKQRERSEEHRSSGKESSHSSSSSRKRSHSEKSPQPEIKRKKYETTSSEVRDEKREKHDRSAEYRYSKKESSHSSSGSRKRSPSPNSSEGQSSGMTRFRIPKKEHKSDDVRDKLDKKPDRREAERSSSEYQSSSRKERPISSSALKKEIKDLLRTEHHHLMKRGKLDSNGDYQGVEWCYKYLDPNIRGHITGGRAILHHRCRQCNRICLHLLGKYGTGKRMCLKCAASEMGWREKEVPSWYYHDEYECSNCRDGHRYGGGSYYYSR